MVEAELTIERGESIAVHTLDNETDPADRASVHIWHDREGVTNVSLFTFASYERVRDYNHANEGVWPGGGDIVQVECRGGEVIKNRQPASPFGKMRLADAPPGLFRDETGCLGLKTEYGGPDELEVFVCASGEYYWGGASTKAERREIMVTPITDE